MRTMGTKTVDTVETSRLPAGPILVRIRRLLITTAIAGVVYSALGTGSKGQCSGMPGTEGQPSTETCVNITMHPSWIVYVAFAAIVFVAIGRVGRLASTVEQAGRIFDRAAIAVMALAAVSIIVGGLWLALLPFDSLTGTGTTIYPFPFNSPELTVTRNP